MESSDMKNMVVIKNLPSNMVDEAIIIFKETQKVKQKEIMAANKVSAKREIPITFPNFLIFILSS